MAGLREKHAAKMRELEEELGKEISRQREEANTKAYLAGSYDFKVAEYEVFRIVGRG